MRKLIAIDSAYADRVARDHGAQYFPTREFIAYQKTAHADVDVIEALVTVIDRVPNDDSSEAIAEAASQTRRKTDALEHAGARVIVCPAKRAADGGFKQSDDARLMVSTLAACMRLRPEFLQLVGADGDYGPLVWELRSEGIRTEVVATSNALATDLRKAAANIIYLDEIWALFYRNNTGVHQ
jgi:hypothetical protein